MGLLFFYSAFSLIPIKISLHLHQPISTLSLTSLFNHFFALSPSTPRHCLPLRRNPGRSIKPSRSLFFFLFFFCNDLKPSSAVSGLRSRWADQWWWVSQLVMGKLMVGELVMGELLVGESLVVSISVLICFCFWFCFSVLVVVI